MHYYVTWQCSKCGKQEKKNQGPTPPSVPTLGKCSANNNLGHVWREIERRTK